jgi:hypothetical protein
MNLSDIQDPDELVTKEYLDLHRNALENALAIDATKSLPL